MANESFAAAMARLKIHSGTYRGELPSLTAAILDLAAHSEPSGIRADAAELGRTTQFSYESWLDALTWIEGHPQRDVLLEMLRDVAAKLGIDPSRAIAGLLADLENATSKEGQNGAQDQ